MNARQLGVVVIIEDRVTGLQCVVPFLAPIVCRKIFSNHLITVCHTSGSLAISKYIFFVHRSARCFLVCYLDLIFSFSGAPLGSIQLRTNRKWTKNSARLHV